MPEKAETKKLEKEYMILYWAANDVGFQTIETKDYSLAKAAYDEIMSGKEIEIDGKSVKPLMAKLVKTMKGYNESYVGEPTPLGRELFKIKVN